MAHDLLIVNDLKKHFTTHGSPRRTVRAVDDVSLTVAEGETVGLVGESGSGKSTLGRLILGLLRADSGSINFDGYDLHRLSRRRLKPIRRDLQAIFQDPYSSLNPQLTIGENILFNLRVHGDTKDMDRRLAKVLSEVGLSVRQGRQYPYELSGGQRQRASIARALILRPKLIIADEPVSALDKSVQAQVLNLLQDLKAEYHLSYLFISHDLNVVDYISDRVAVMYFGKIVETATSDEIYSQPRHPYTQLMLKSIPTVDGKLAVLDNGSTEGATYDNRCAFAARCTSALPRCTTTTPPVLAPQRLREVRCHLYQDGVPASARQFSLTTT